MENHGPNREGMWQLEAPEKTRRKKKRKTKLGGSFRCRTFMAQKKEDYKETAQNGFLFLFVIRCWEKKKNADPGTWTRCTFYRYLFSTHMTAEVS